MRQTHQQLLGAAQKEELDKHYMQGAQRVNFRGIFFIFNS